LITLCAIYNSRMRLSILAGLILFALSSPANAVPPQNTATTEPKSVTVPITLDHDRIVIDVYLPLPDGSTKRVRGWVDTGNPELRMSQQAAKLMGLTVICDSQTCSTSKSSLAPPLQISIGGMKLLLPAAKITILAGIPTIAPGMSAEIAIPASILRNYDVLINFPDREFSIGHPGTLKFNGVSSKMIVDADSGLIQVPSKLQNKNYNLLLDIGAPLTFLSGPMFAKLAVAHPDWPHMTGAVGPANMWGASDEAKWPLMRVDRVQFGPLYLTDVPVIAWPEVEEKLLDTSEKLPPAGAVGTSALMNYRVGLDYLHSKAYFDLGTTFKLPEFDVVGLILRPDPDTRFTIIGIADYDGKPSVPSGEDGVKVGDHLVGVDGIPVAGSTMGQVWSLLQGSPGQERKLTVEREGRQVIVSANVRHFLAEAEENQSTGKSCKRK
jgi:hypothetical protein